MTELADQGDEPRAASVADLQETLRRPPGYPFYDGPVTVPAISPDPVEGQFRVYPPGDGAPTAWSWDGRIRVPFPPPGYPTSPLHVVWPDGQSGIARVVAIETTLPTLDADEKGWARFGAPTTSVWDLAGDAPPPWAPGWAPPQGGEDSDQ